MHNEALLHYYGLGGTTLAIKWAQQKMDAKDIYCFKKLETI